MPQQKRRVSVDYSPKFLKSLSKLSSFITDQAKQKEDIFLDDVFDARLKTHKLHGKNKDSWAFWINDSYRIKFIFLSDNEILFLDIGTHDIYK